MPDEVLKIIYWCTHCGEVCKGKYCNMCTTVEGRKEVDRLNAEIRNGIK